ncbi:MAG: polyribonucleotide nucleotidyltransferase [Clostridiales bacterium]|mgnify:FL=1|nr:polyribonucleotide nucleotidyltransferase [Clostridiales bacterium]MDD7415190.1 polyribonucleotide nucleotidyltransferase [Clostridiales bacterium]MDY5732868.1 polyribonucleotide nucleotidyltransferase [Eubacteriales bacterium]
MFREFRMKLAGRELIVETGKYAEQAGGSCMVRCGGTAVLVCATVAKTARDGVDFLPLSCEFEEKMYAVGKIPGGFIKREGRPTEKAVLTSRLIDRPLRPLFPKGFYNDVQVIATVMSVEQDVQPDVLAMIGSSIALSISEAPFMGPTGAVSVGYVDGEYIINPNSLQRELSRMQLTVAGTRDAVMMVEAGAQEVTEAEMLRAILLAHEEIKRIVDFIDEIAKEIGKPKCEVEVYKPDEILTERVRDYAFKNMQWALDTFDRKEREARSQQVKDDTIAQFAEEFPDSAKDIDNILYGFTKEIVREKIINKGIRPDGRTYEQIRPIWCEVGILPRTHGSAVFTRGQTQVLTVATLGAMGDGQTLDGISEEEFKRYMHQYNMPPYSVGETRVMRGPGRREIGHGALAERSLVPVLPNQDDFPYAIRLVSEVISSNGSTSQASVCASTLALMDAGVPIKKPVAGVAMGLIQDPETGKIVVLTDIQGLEDFLGDMDFKVAGTKDGITAIQMDIKIKGINEEILTRALAQAREGRLFILGKMLETLSAPRAELSPYAPRILQFTINPDKIREVIGTGGKTINKIIADTGVKIDIEDDGRVFIASPDQEAAAEAMRMIEAIVKDIEIGDVYLGKVVSILPIGAQVEIKPGKKGLVHISKLSNKRVERVEDVVSLGDEILVRVIDIKPDGKIDLTHKGLLPDDRR